MPLFIDIHEIPGLTTEAAAAEHVKDLDEQGTFGVTYAKYWVNEAGGKVFCLCDAPNAEAAIAVHRRAHGGMAAERIIEVTPELADLFLGPSLTNVDGAVMLPDTTTEHDTATRTIVFTDIVDSTGLTARLGDAGAMRSIAIHDEAVHAAVSRFGGREVKHTGDGIMSVFLFASDAVNAALAILTQLARQIADDAVYAPRVRIGLATGEPVEREGDFFGSSVQLASRLCAQAAPGEVLVSQSVVELCANEPFIVRERGAQKLRGFAEPVPIYSVVRR